MKLRRTHGIRKLLAGLALTLVGALVMVQPCHAYSVIMHQAIIDAEWDSKIKPYLLRHFPDATPEQLQEARAYAYGGSVIQDMGYYPLGSRYFSHLTHYVRTGDFVQALFEESRDVNEMAFALGALSHYCADIQGHSLGVNKAVPMLYPKLRAKYGDYMTWEDSPYAHVLTEFGFDTLEVVAGHVAPQEFHDSIGFKVAKGALQRAFLKTYGIKLSDQMPSTSLALAVYRKVASQLIPEMTEVAWAARRKSLEADANGLHHKSLFHLTRVDAGKWENVHTTPGIGDKVTAIVFRLIPKFGPLNVFEFHPPTEATDKLFADSLKATIADYERKMQDPEFDPPNINLDTGLPTRPGEYRYCDGTVARLLHQLEKTHFSTLTPGLRARLLEFYDEADADTGPRSHKLKRRVQHDLDELRAVTLASNMPSP